MSFRLFLAALAFTPLAQPAAAQVAIQAPSGWTVATARELLGAIADSAREGLTPADYQPAALARAIEEGDGPALDAVANGSAMALARDYLLGRVADRDSYDWHIERSAYEAFALNDGLKAAVAKGEVRGWLASLLPTDPQYAALRDRLARTDDATEVALIRANMERWRWLPRRLGDSYLFVNVPTYRLRVVRDGAEQASYDVVVGAPKTPTPALAVPAERVVVNPWWTVPPAVLAEGGGYSAAKGYVRVRAASGKTLIRQRPGPANALGRIKIDMPNDHAIYLHDTPAKGAFARNRRALSHGCIRVRGIDQLAAELEQNGQIEAALTGDETATIALARPVPVYIVYLTAEAGPDGRVQPLDDIYGRDARLIAALDAGAATRLAGAGRVVAAR